jgi:uncharacterized protein involved in exopolysaccharide biosynthesis
MTPSPDRPTSSSASGGRPPDDRVSLWAVLAELIRGRRAIVGLAAVGALVSALVVLQSPPAFVVETSFRPQGREDGLGQLSSVAAQLGLRAPGQAQAESPELYAELIRSRAVLKPLAEREFTGALDEPAPLHRILELEEEDRGIRTAHVVRWLREEAVSTSVGRQTGIVNVTVQTRWAPLSAQLAQGVLNEIDRFNAETRRSRAAAERQFVEERLADARAELLAAEAKLKEFLLANRQWQGSPELRFEHDRLEREMLRHQQLFTSLGESFQQARIAEVRNTPVITILEEPYVPSERESRGLLKKLLAGLLVGAGSGVAIVLLRVATSPDRPEDRRALEEVRGWWSAVRSGRIRDIV